MRVRIDLEMRDIKMTFFTRLSSCARAEERFSAEPQHQGQVTLLGGDGEVDSEVYEVHWHEVVVDISFVWDSLTKSMFRRTSAELIWELCSLSPTVCGAELLGQLTEEKAIFSPRLANYPRLRAFALREACEIAPLVALESCSPSRSEYPIAGNRITMQ
jgi:hypothetical protein